MSETAVDSYWQKLTECRLDPIGDPLIDGIREPSPFSSRFLTSEVLEKALGWQQEFAARVRKYQEEPDMPLEERKKAANLLVNLAAEAGEAVRALSVAFPDVFKAIASRKASFPINIPALPEDRDEIIRWLTETLQFGSEHELKLRGRKAFPRRPFGNQLILRYLGRIKETAIERRRLRNENPFEWESVELTPEETLTHIGLCAATARQWMEAIWNLLLVDYPAPEENTRLKQWELIEQQGHQKTRQRPFAPEFEKLYSNVCFGSCRQIAVEFGGSVLSRNIRDSACEHYVSYSRQRGPDQSRSCRISQSPSQDD